MITTLRTKGCHSYIGEKSARRDRVRALIFFRLSACSSCLCVVTEDTLSPPAPEPPVERRKSQLFAPLLHRRRSQHVHDEDVSPTTASTDEDHEHENRLSQESHRNSRDMTRVLPKRSQTLRTQPYQAPYFFPTPGSVEAESYLPPRRKPVRSKTLSPDEVEHCEPQEIEC